MGDSGSNSPTDVKQVALAVIFIDLQLFVTLLKIQSMSKEEIKTEIGKVLDHFSDNALNELLLFLKELDKKQNSLLSDNALDKILKEDKSLLAKLAK